MRPMRPTLSGRKANCAPCARAALPLGDDFAYARVPGLSREMVERLQRARPATLADAGRVPGITPAALAALLVQAKRQAA